MKIRLLKGAVNRNTYRVPIGIEKRPKFALHLRQKRDFRGVTSGLVE